MVNGVLTIPLSGIPIGSAEAGEIAAPRLPEFIAGSENSLAAAALTPFLKQDPGTFSPLILCGPHGSGKTHLARGLADWWRRHDPAAHVCEFTGAQFAQQVHDAVAGDRLPAWREAVRGTQLFVLDNLNELTSKQAAQVELLHTLDALLDAEAAIVVTARKLPGQWSILNPALRGRLSAGLTVPLVFPARATRRVILERLVALRGVRLGKRAIDSLVGMDGSVPKLISALMELELTAGTAEESNGADRAERLVAERQRATEPSLREIANLTARYFGLKLSDLKSSARRRALVAARGVAMYLARELTSNSLGQIGRYFGGRDHTTVLYGCRRTEKLLSRDRATRQAIGELRKLLSSA